MSAISQIPGRLIRRRLVAFAVLLGLSLALMASSANPAVREVQAAIGFAFAPIQSGLADLGRTVRSVVDAVSEIDRLRIANRALIDEIERLRVESIRVRAIEQDYSQLTAILQVQNALRYASTPVEVIGRESSEFRRVVSISAGSGAGIAVGDVVVAAGGALAGRVVDVGANFARVVLITDASSTVIGQAATSRATGEVVGQLGGPLVMQNIDSTERLQIGETVLTAGIQVGPGIRSPYPKGLIIGQVIDVVRDPNAVVQTAFLQPPIDLDKVEFLLVITDYEGGLPDDARDLPTTRPPVTPAPKKRP